ncbi:MAG: glycosyl transferase [Actinomycetota bacterium]|nr:glycosyl transferase [Actinomycetota bacterium]
MTQAARRGSHSATGASLRIFLGAFGDPGHAFPMLALGSRLAARGHEVTFETWKRWREPVQAAGMRFLPAPEYAVFPTRQQPLKPYQAVVLAVPQTHAAVRELEPDVVVHDILTMAPALAAELEGVPSATLIPHFHPTNAPGNPPYAFGARAPRTAAGRRLWRAFEPPVRMGLALGRTELNEARAKLGLAPVRRLLGGLSERLCLVGTFPQLEYPRAWAPEVRIVGPLLWEPPYHHIAPPPGEDPLVLVAVSTAQDPEHELLRAALAGLAGERVRVIAATNRKPLRHRVTVSQNAKLVDWISYSDTMPNCAGVISHGGHGTVVRSLASGAPLLAVPHSGDMGENAARLDWAGVGVRLPWRLLGPRTLRLALRRLLDSPEMAARARSLAGWAEANDGATRAAELVEELAAFR